MTNKVICVEKVLKLIKDQTRSSTSEFSDGWNNALFMVMQNAESGNLSPSPAPAEGVISTVTNCPTCGSAVKVGGDGETHYYIPITPTTNTR